MLFAATVCNAQVVLWDGTDKEVGSDGGFWNRAEPTVVEDEGNKIMKFTLKRKRFQFFSHFLPSLLLPLKKEDVQALRK